MQVAPAVRAIVDNCESGNPGSKASPVRIPMQGKLGGAGNTKPPMNAVSLEATTRSSTRQNTEGSMIAARVRHVVCCCLDSTRIVVFSGGKVKIGVDALCGGAHGLTGGANGSIMGRSTFQRPERNSRALLDRVIAVTKSTFNKRSLPMMGRANEGA